MDYWNSILDEKHHKHEKGEDRSKCINCELIRRLNKFTNFEAFCFIWFRENISQFTFDAHLISELLSELKLKDLNKKLFLKASSMIYSNDMKISEARARRDAKK